MTVTQTIFAVLTCFFIFSFIIYLIKKGVLREEYAWLWFLTGIILLILVLWYDLLVFITQLIGAVAPTTTIFIFGIIFLIMLSLHFAIKISVLTGQVKNLAQKLSLLEAESRKTDGGYLKD